jgi:hypothetical protein
MMVLKEARQAALFEKSAQKLLLIWTVVVKTPMVQILFVHKRSAFSVRFSRSNQPCPN